MSDIALVNKEDKNGAKGKWGELNKKIQTRSEFLKENIDSLSKTIDKRKKRDHLINDITYTTEELLDKC